MSFDWILSSSLILLAGAIWGLIHSWMASLQAKRMARRLFGPAADRVYRLFYNTFAAISLLPLLALAALLPDHLIYAIPAPWVFLTLALQGLAALALLIGLLQTGLGDFIGLRQLFDPKLEKPQPLVVSGLYRCVRHPLYTAGLAFIWLTPQMTINLLALYACFSLYLVIGAYFEERKLLAEHGEAYRKYQHSTPMLIPRLPCGNFKV